MWADTLACILKCVTVTIPYLLVVLCFARMPLHW